jgi:hypothetical protein
VKIKKEIIEILKPSMNILDNLAAGKFIKKRVVQFLKENQV